MDSPTNREGAVDLIETHAEGVKFRSDGTKTFVPLEANPEAFERLAAGLGVSSELGFYDVYSIDEPELLAMLPRPVHAVIFIVAAGVYHKVRSHDKVSEYGGAGDDAAVFWAKQTIGHACGTMALLHCLSNGDSKRFVQSEGPLDLLIQECTPLEPKTRAATIYNSLPLEQAHMAAAWQGQSYAPDASEPNDNHFIAFVKSDRDNHLYELEGGCTGPIDRGLLAPEDDLLSEDALNKGIRRFIALADGVLEFGMLALASKTAV